MHRRPLLWAAISLAAATSAAAAETVTLRAVGDLAFYWNMGDAIAKTDFDPFADLKGALGASDLTFANLETVLSKAPAPKGVIERPGVPLIRGPARAAELMAKAGIDVVSYANNHVFDFGAAGMADTLAVVRAAGIAAVGSGESQDDAHKAWITTVKGVKIGLLALAKKTNHPPHGKGVFANMNDGKALVEALAREVDVVLVSIHWGTQYQLRPDSKQVKLAHELVDAGADAIIGHHPHVLQSVEVYAGRPIVYSLGNFVFGTQPDPRHLTAIFELELAKGPAPIARATLIPCVLRGKLGSPMVSLEKEGNPVRKRLREASKPFRTVIVDRNGNLDLELIARSAAK